MTFIAAALKWVDRRPEVDPLTGAVRTDPRTSGASDADQAALEWALRLGETWGWDVTAVTAGRADSEPVLREALGAGAGRVVRIDMDPSAPSGAVAAAMAPALAGAGLVLCGDWSLDRGSGSVPAFLAAELGVPQALGLVGLESTGEGSLRLQRRLDGGRRELLSVTGPAVLSVEGSTARLRRGPLGAVLAARAAPVKVMTPRGRPGEEPRPRSGPYRPRPRVLAAPDPHLSARERVLALTGALVARTPPRRVELDADEAAAAILRQLEEWRA